MLESFLRSRKLWHQLTLGAFILALAPGSSDAHAKLYLTKDEALRLAFGKGASVQREAVFLTEKQLARARELAGGQIEIKWALITQYVGEAEGDVLGTAYFDTHRVRTLQETIMVVVNPDGTVGRVEILSFGEPREYVPKKAWLEQFPGRRLDRSLALKRGIHAITGATLSARAVTEATRRILAIHRALSDRPPAVAGNVGAP